MSRHVPLPRLGELARRVTGAPAWPVAAAAALGLLAMIEILVRTGDAGSGAGGGAGAGGGTAAGAGLLVALLLGLAGTVPVGFARAYPVAVAGTVGAAVGLLLATPPPLPVAALVALVAAFYLVGRRCSGRVGGLVLVPFAGYAVVALAVQDQLADRWLPAGLAALAAAAVGLGGFRRARRIAAEREVSRRAVADTLLEHAARGERARIARDLHDVVAHHISMIAVQAETARLVTAGMPPDGARALLAIGDTARTALTEMRRLLGVLREDTGGPAGSTGGTGAAAREPQPGLAQLVELVDQARDSAGVSTRLIVRGGVRPLDPGVELTAYRIVQEALTNARRHAPGAAVDVECQYGGDALRLRVWDNGAGPPSGSTADGHGLLGMRERAAAVGGQLWTGSGPAGGFVVESRLPVPVPVPGASAGAGRSAGAAG